MGMAATETESRPFGHRFLVQPELFPLRHGGESWGDERVDLRFLGGPYALSGLSAAQLRDARARFADLCHDASSGPTAVPLRIFRAPRSEFHTIHEVGWEYSLDLRYAPDRVDLAGMELMGSLRWRPDLSAAMWTWAAEGETFTGALENLFRAAVAYRLAETNGVVLHSAAVLERDRAHVFLGRSGAGKTTISRLSAGAGRTVLSDDLNAIVWRDGTPVVCQMPFSGDFGQARRVTGEFPLAGLYRLHQGGDVRLDAMSPAAGLGILAACATAVGRDPHRSDAVIDRLASLVHEMPVRGLTFSRSDDPWGVLDAA